MDSVFLYPIQIAPDEDMSPLRGSVPLYVIIYNPAIPSGLYKNGLRKLRRSEMIIGVDAD